MPKKRNIPAYSNTTGKHYESWDALVSAEANGYVAVAIIDDGKDSWPWVVGPFPTEREATNQAAALRRMANKGEFNNLIVKVRVRPAWKPTKARKAIAKASDGD